MLANVTYCRYQLSNPLVHSGHYSGLLIKSHFVAYAWVVKANIVNNSHTGGLIDTTEMN